MGFVDTFLNIDVMQRVFPMLWRGIGNTFALAAATLVVGSLTGVILCLMRLYGALPFRLFAIAWIDVFRAIPILVLLVLIYYALPFMGVRLSSFASAVLALSLVFAAFTAEVFRAGIQAIPKGQHEAAASMGLPFPIIIWKVILPQALRLALPSWSNEPISLLKTTAIVFLIAVQDLMAEGKRAATTTLLVARVARSKPNSTDSR